MADGRLTPAVDLGGTRMRAGVVADTGEVILGRTEATPRGSARRRAHKEPSRG